MEKGKWNWPLVTGVWVAYWIFFIIYLFYSRTPDYFIGSKTEGQVIGVYDKVVGFKRRKPIKSSCPIVYYYVDSVQYQFYSDNENYLGFYAKGDKVTMIYNPDNPKEACVLGLIGYWINISEILTALLIIAIISAFITVVPHGYGDKVTTALKE
jgi:hypothetical protein